VGARFEGSGPLPTDVPSGHATVPLVEGPALVDLLSAGDPGGLAAVYDAYADRLFTYCVSLLRDREAAADTVHDALLIARERAGQLRDPERLRSWLYAIARNECLRALRDRRRTTDFDETAAIDESADVEAALRADELRELVWSAAASLRPSEREVLELSVRHGLEGADLADALGVSGKHAAIQLSRARARLERALAALVLARAGRYDCSDLDGLLDDWDGRLTPLVRKRLVRHLQRCPICSEQRQLRVSAAALLAGVPFLVAPSALRERVLRDAGDTRLVADWQALAERAGPYHADGFPRRWGDRHRMIGLSAAGAAAIVLLTLGLFVLPGSTQVPVAGQALESSSTAPTTGGAPTPTQTPTPTRTLTPTATNTPTPSGTPGPTTPLAVTTAPPSTPVPTTPVPVTSPATAPATGTTTTPPPAPPPTPQVSTRSGLVAASCKLQTWTAQLYADVSGAQPATVVAHWYVDPAKPAAVGMALQGTLWLAAVSDLPTNTTIGWYVTVTTVDGVVANSGPDTLRYDCPAG
jgi:RNA polymerase sigma factor (sigma-70 family)